MQRERHGRAGVLALCLGLASFRPRGCDSSEFQKVDV